jgi:tetratricopeptide (TPR) repeat protein
VPLSTPTRALRLLLAAGALPGGAVLVPHAATAQELAQTQTRAERRDSARTLGGAREAQARFERVRMNHFPWTNNSWGGSCDEVVGRFCLTYGDAKDDEDEKPPPPEHEAVTEARGELIERLGAAAERLPGDGWIAGQRVRYLVEAGRMEDAITAADACRAEPAWWCTALRGYAHHAAGDYNEADSAFSLALRQMPEKDRDRWTDLSLLLTGEALKEYRRSRGAARDSLERRFWWLAEPLQMTPGNERRTEHYARHVLDRLQTRARSTDGTSWGGDLRELLLRYGAPVAWERVRPRYPALGADVSIVSHYPPRSREFFPSRMLHDDPTRLGPDDLPLRLDRAHTGYAPRGVASFDVLEHQLARFRRGDSVVVVAAYAMKPDSARPAPLVEAGLVLSENELARPIVVHSLRAQPRDVLSVTMPPTAMLMSLEVRAPEGGRVARARYGIRLEDLPPHGVAISDVLLLTDADEPPRSLTEAMPRARGSLRVRSGERVGLYWEVYGVRQQTDAMRVGVTLRGSDRSWLRRLGERAGVLRADAPLALSWNETAAADDVLPRALAVELPALAPGRYTLEVTVTLPGREPLVSRRELHVEE